MKIHEYQAKALLSEFGIPVPEGGVAATPAEAKKIAAELGGKVVIKAQVYAGGRGKAGGIKVANTPEEAGRLAGEMLGTRLVTHQTTPEGVPVSKVLVEKAVDVERELYLSIIVDNASRMPVMMASEAGGMDIEEVARTSPEKILKVYAEQAAGFQAFQGRKLGYGMNLSPAQVRPATGLMTNLYRLFQAKDCSLAEINPLVVTVNGDLLALDAKLDFEDNALFRHSDIEQLHDLEQEDPLEARANELGIKNYVKMDGNIGCMVNGAGLAMAVMDLITYAGGAPANFLDIGAVNNTDRVVNAFKIFTADSSVKAILVNAFGGIARVDVIAQGIVEAHKQMDVRLPLVIRLAGTNVDEGKRILAESKIDFIEAADFHDAARKAVAAAKGS
ncbi:MAG: ADP-forming succinate--CoA ligase subunit beta, partial [Dehalococcoidia bacterium]|nr:ADP-forming succinate--CoA ligase subunit beta [Dehalococcoidia bacterium]